MDQPTLESVAALEALVAVHHAAAAPVFRAAGVSESDGALLWAIEQAGRELTMSEAAVALRCDASNITLLARHLEAAELVERVPDQHDRRARRLRLRPEGRRVMREVVDALDTASPLAGLTVADRDALHGLLRVATGRLSGDEQR